MKNLGIGLLASLSFACASKQKSEFHAQGGSREYRNTIDQQLRENQEEFRFCFEKYANSKPKILSGKILVKFEIQNSGKVANEAIKHSDFDNLTLQNCVLEGIRKTHFHSYEGELISVTSYPIKFEKFEN